MAQGASLQTQKQKIANSWISTEFQVACLLLLGCARQRRSTINHFGQDEKQSNGNTQRGGERHWRRRQQQALAKGAQKSNCTRHDRPLNNPVKIPLYASPLSRHCVGVPSSIESQFHFNVVEVPGVSSLRRTKTKMKRGRKRNVFVALELYIEMIDEWRKTGLTRSSFRLALRWNGSGLPRYHWLLWWPRKYTKNSCARIYLVAMRRGKESTMMMMWTGGAGMVGTKRERQRRKTIHTSTWFRNSCTYGWTGGGQHK